MSIAKMKFVCLQTTENNYAKMLLDAANNPHFHGELGQKVLPYVSKSTLYEPDNVYAGYLSVLKNIAHSIRLDIDEIDDQATYTVNQIDQFIIEVQEKFKLVAKDMEEGLVGKDDQVALNNLAKYGYEKLHQTMFIDFVFGRIPITSFNKLDLFDKRKFVYEEVYRNDHYVWILVGTSKTYLMETKLILEGLFLESIRIPEVDCKRIIQEYRDVFASYYHYVKKMNDLYLLHKYLICHRDLFCLYGFIDQADLEQIQEDFSYAELVVQDEGISHQFRPPTKLKNIWLFKPFELFVDMYSLPDYFDIDPTPFVAITYCLLFGIMFGDLGQGLILFIVGLWFEKKKHNQLMGIIGRCGITSMIFGFIYGSFFGYEHLLNPLHQRFFGVEDKLIEVMDASYTMFLLIMAVAIGALLIVITMLINMYVNHKHHNLAELLMSNNGLAGLVFYVFIALSLTSQLLYQVSLFNRLTIIIFVIIPILCFFFKESVSLKLTEGSFRPHDGWGNYVLETVFEVFEILLSFVTNSMSYLRVGGFVLSHAGMMLVVMTLNEMAGHFGIAVVIFGNLFVMGLEGMIVGIQTLRLEFYEMFSRYFTGGGKEFTMIKAK